MDEVISACEEMILLNAHRSDEGKQFWLKVLEQTGFTSAAKTEKLLREIEGHTIEKLQRASARSCLPQ